ncbi:MAG: hypothetical protein V2G41_10020 [bacterium JZ-2024 1]
MNELLEKPWFVIAVVVVASLGLLSFLMRRREQPMTTIVQREVNLDPITTLIRETFGGLAQQEEETRKGILGLYESQQATLTQGVSGILKTIADTTTSSLAAINAGLKAVESNIISQFQQQQTFITTEFTKQQQSIAEEFKKQQQEQQKMLDSLAQSQKIQSDINAFLIGQNSFLACYDAKVGWRRECLFAKGTLGRSGLEDISNLQKAEQEAQKYSECRKSDKTYDLLCAGRKILQQQFPDNTGAKS